MLVKSFPNFGQIVGKYFLTILDQNWRELKLKLCYKNI